MPTKYPGTEDEVRALTAYIALSRATARVLHATTAHLRTQGLTPSQFGILDALYHLGPLNQRELARKLLLSTGNITAVLQNIDRMELIHRQRDEADQRSITVSLTEKGRTVIERILPRHVTGIVNALRILTPAEQQTLTALCRKLGMQPFGDLAGE